MTRLLRDPRFWVTALLTLATALVALFAPWVAPHPPNEMSAAHRLKGPEASFLLGTDEFGRDILSRLVFGARLSLLISVSSVAIAAALGSLLGLVAGYRGGMKELLIMRSVDAILSFPPIILALFVVVFIGPKLQNVILTIGVLYVPRFARVIHSVTLSAKQNEYVEAARALGARDWRIIWRCLLPNALAPAMVQVSLALGDAILLESSLSFLGMGPPPPATAWGRMIAQSAPFMHLSAYALLWPAAAVSTAVLTFNIFGDSVRDALDPRLKS